VSQTLETGQVILTTPISGLLSSADCYDIYVYTRYEDMKGGSIEVFLDFQCRIKVGAIDSAALGPIKK